MIGSAKLLIIIATIQLGFIPSCISVVSAASTGLLTGSPAAATPENRTDCDNPDNAWKLEKLNGKVKELREEEIEYHRQTPEKELTRLVTFGSTGDYVKDDQRQYYRLIDYSKFEKPTFVFDKNCRILERRDPKRPYLIAGATRSVYSYTSSGTPTEEAIYDSQGRLQWKSVAVLDKNGRVIEHKITSQEHPEHFNPERHDVYNHSRRVYKLDVSGNQIEEISYNTEGKFHGIYKRAYDSSRRLVRELRLDHKKRPIELAIFKFDEAGVLREELRYNSSGYSGLDKLMPGKLNSGYGMFQEGYRTTYEYDISNNWVKKSEFDLAESGRLNSDTYRTLVYY
jgi:hypothetical protein